MIKISRNGAAMIAILSILGGCTEKAAFHPSQQSGGNPTLPKAQNFLIPPMQVPEGVGWKQGQTPQVAAGLQIERIADGLQHPRQLLVLPNGDVLVVESNGPGSEPTTTPKQLIAGIVKGRSGKAAKGGNRITLLRKITATGPWERHIFLSNLHSPFGLQLIGGFLYVANTDGIVKYPYVTGQTEITAPGVVWADLPSTVNHHWTKALLANSDGSKLYVGVGSNSNITENSLAVEYRRATVLEVDVATGGSRIYASGLRNPTGLQWDKPGGTLWAIVNERDEIGADLVPDYMTSVRESGFYGWPYSYYGQHVDERVKPPMPELVAKALVPDYALGPHTASLGLVSSVGTALPARFASGMFIGQHGSWNRRPHSGYKVIFVPFDGSRAAGESVDVLTGFLSEDGNAFGRPVGVALDKQGALLVADDVGNTVWRVSTRP